MIVSKRDTTIYMAIASFETVYSETGPCMCFLIILLTGFHLDQTSIIPLVGSKLLGHTVMRSSFGALSKITTLFFTQRSSTWDDNPTVTLSLTND